MRYENEMETRKALMMIKCVCNNQQATSSMQHDTKHTGVHTDMHICAKKNIVEVNTAQ